MKPVRITILSIFYLTLFLSSLLLVSCANEEAAAPALAGAAKEQNTFLLFYTDN